MSEGKTPDVTTTPEPVKEEIKEKTADVKVEKSAETSTRKKQDKLTNLITLKTNGKITYKCTLDVINENQVRITVKGAKKSGDKREIKVDEVVNLDNKNTYYDQICEWIKKYYWGSGVETKKIQEAVKAFIIKHGSEFNKEDVAEL